MLYRCHIHCIGALLVLSFVCLSVCLSVFLSVYLSVSQLVHPFVLWLVLLLVLQPDMHCIGALSVLSFVCLSVSQSIHWSFVWFSCRSFHRMDASLSACQTCLEKFYFVVSLTKDSVHYLNPADNLG